MNELPNQHINVGIAEQNGAGGDTMVHVLKALGAKGIELVDYVIPQADLGRIIGGGQDGLVVVGKGGLTGKDDTAELIVKRIFAESVKK